MARMANGGTTRARPVFTDRIFRCGQSDYYSDEILLAGRTHTTARLRAIADAGFSGIWLHARLRELVPGRLFRSCVKGSDDRFRALASLCARTRRCGLDVWLYFTEPLGLGAGHRFWKDHPELKGHTGKAGLGGEPDASLCSSTDPVRQFLHDGFGQLFSRLPLGGAILITASEHVSNCWSNVMRPAAQYASPVDFWSRACSCPRCGPRGPVEVVCEVINLINRGARTARPDAKVVAWDWAWNMYLAPPYRRLVDGLDPEVVLMGDFERGGRARRMGRSREVEEYSLFSAGPSPRYRTAVRAFAPRRPMGAKLQVNTTHELATVPALPLLVSLYRKFRYLREAGMRGYMATWNFGCRPDTLNAFAVDRLSRGRPDRDRDRWLSRLVMEYFRLDGNGRDAAAALVGFARAGESYPIGSNCFLYFSPVNYALAYPLKLRFTGKPMGPTWIAHEHGDRLEDTAGDYTLAELVELLERLHSRWDRAAHRYGQALQSAADHRRARREVGVTRVAGATFRSTWNIYRWYLARRRRQAQRLSAADKAIVANEIENVRAALPYVEADDRLGFHEEPQCYMFDTVSMKRKLRVLGKLLQD